MLDTTGLSVDDVVERIAESGRGAFVSDEADRLPLSRPHPHARFAAVLKATAGRLLLAAFRVRAVDIDRIPASSGAILAGNHVSYGDPTLLWCVAPRQVRFMGKAELWDNPLFAWVLARVLAFPVRRGAADRQAISTATGYLKEGSLVGIFPEGTRSRNAEGLGEGQEGVAFIAMRAGVPIVPVGIDGTARIKPEGTRMLRFPRVTMCFGEPVDPSRLLRVAAQANG